MDKKNKSIASLLILLSTLFFLIIVNYIPLQFDLSAQGNYTLSQGSKELLKEIEEPITLDFYFSQSAEGIPNQLTNFGDRVAVFLNQYKRHSNGMLQVRKIDPKPDTKEEEAAIRAGINGQPTPTGDRFFFGLVATQADTEESIPLITIQREAYLEYDISKLISQVQQLSQTRIGILSTLPVQGMSPQQIPGMPMPQQQGQPEWVFYNQLNEQFELVSVDFRGESIDPALDALMVIHPQELSEVMQFELDQFVLSGKPVIIAVDPSNFTQRQSMGQQAMMMGGGNVSSSLDALFSGWGIDYDPMSVVGDLDFAARVNAGAGQPVPFPVWMQIREFDDAMPPVSALNEVLFVEAGHFSLSEDSEHTLTPLIQTSANSSTTFAQMLMFSQPAQIMSQMQSNLENEPGEAMTVAGIIEGTFPTAFPAGRPVEEVTEEDDIDPSDDADSNLATPTEDDSLKSGDARIVLFTDVDFLNDGFSVQRMNMLGTTILQPLNDNLNLVLNVTEFINGSEELISLRGRGTQNREFEKVRELEAVAQARFQSQLDEINARISEIQTELSQIQVQQNEQGVLIASGELEDAIERFREEEASAVAQRREIRKKLREDIELLDRNLAMFNLLFIPVILVISGIAYFYVRSRKTR